jgi:hypothetical protein
MTNETTNNETINAFCDVCSNQQTDTDETLESEGWYLGSREQFCPVCND